MKYFFIFLILNLYPKIYAINVEKDSIKTVKKPQKEKKIEKITDEFVNIKDISSDFVLDIKYATSDNFLKQSVYDCPECYLKKEVAKALSKANEVFKKSGYKIKIFDCYRPLAVQKKMWNILPGTNYVANPKKGSKHNKGIAVDITLVDAQGNEVDMGTPFDSFSEKSHHSYQKLPKEVLQHRKLLKDVMKQHNFKSIFSEWWHYEYVPLMNAPVKDIKWDCK